MTKRQILVVAVLGLANGLAIAAVVLWVVGTLRTPTHSSVREMPTAGRAASSLTPTTVVPTRIVAIGPLDPCEWRAAESLAGAGLVGTVTYSPTQLLRFDIRYAPAPDRAPDDAAQLVWIAFDVAVALQETAECRDLKLLSVHVLIPSPEGNLQVTAEVDTEDVTAFYNGQLTEERFIDRVTYRTSTARSQ
jgi:hypothetical protein